MLEFEESPAKKSRRPAWSNILVNLKGSGPAVRMGPGWPGRRPWGPGRVPSGPAESLGARNGGPEAREPAGDPGDGPGAARMPGKRPEGY